MRRNNGSRLIVRRRNNRRRRRAAALRAPARRQVVPFRTLTLPLSEQVGLLATALSRLPVGGARALNGFLHVLPALLGRTTLASVRIAVRSAVALGRSIFHWTADGGRRLWAASPSGLSRGTRHTRAMRSFLYGSLMRVLAVLRAIVGRVTAVIRSAALAPLRWLARVQLPDLPGGDPVLLGASAGASILLIAGLVVVLNGHLRRHEAEPADIASVTEPARDMDSWEWTPAPDPDDAGTAESVAPTSLAEVPAETTLPATGTPVVATAPKPEDTPSEAENLAAAMPLLDIPEVPEEETSPSTAALPALPTIPESRPFTSPILPQWLANAVEPRLKGRGPMIAIVIDDAGVAQARTARSIELPPPLTIAFIPYSRNLEAQTRRARQRGHELLVHIPMEPDSGTADPGPNALLTELDRDEIMRRFRWALKRFDGYVGVNNHMGSKFMARADLVEPLLAEMNARGLMFLDSRTDRTTVGARLADGMGLPHASRNVFLDNELDADKIEAQLARLERLARRDGHAIAIGHPHDVTIDVLAQWIPKARARGFALVPVSTIVKLRYGGEYGAQLAARGGKADGLLGSPQ